MLAGDRKTLCKQYVIVTLIITILVVLAAFLMNFQLRKMMDDARVINVAGKQRMYSQRTALLASEMVIPHKAEWARSSLFETLEAFERDHKYLLHGDYFLKSQGGGEALVLSPKMRDLYFKDSIDLNGVSISLDAYLDMYFSKVYKLLLQPLSEVNVSNKIWQDVVVNHHEVLLTALDNIVRQYEKESSDRKSFLSTFQFVTLFLLYLSWIFVLFFILRPMNVELENKTSLFLDEEKKRKHNEKFAALGKVSSGMAHEINNSLQPIVGTGEFILEELQDKSDPMYVQQMKVIMRGAKHIQGILENVLSYTHEGSSKYETYDAFEFINETVSFYRGLLTSQLQFDVSVDDVLKKVQIKGNKTELVQVFGNLFKNAIFAMGGNGAITVVAGIDFFPNDYTRKAVCIKIQDYGCGMSADVASKIFDPFFTTKDISEGTGLGLSAVYGMIQSHGGQIEVETKEGEGTSFYIYMPYF